jgi:hypothetical protein
MKLSSRLASFGLLFADAYPAIVQQQWFAFHPF